MQKDRRKDETNKMNTRILTGKNPFYEKGKKHGSQPSRVYYIANVSTTTDFIDKS
jgi:hypothetical protein